MAYYSGDQSEITQDSTLQNISENMSSDEDSSSDSDIEETEIEYLGTPRHEVEIDENLDSLPTKALNFTGYTSMVDSKKVSPTANFSNVGTIVKSGGMNKRNGKRNKFHMRHFTLRGFRLYFYKHDQCRTARGFLILPKMQPTFGMCGKLQTFVIPKGISRGMELYLDDFGETWRQVLSNQIGYRAYLSAAPIPDNSVVEFFESPGAKILEAKNLPIDAFKPIADVLPLRRQLECLTLSDWNLQNSHVDMLVESLRGCPNVKALDLSANKLNADIGKIMERLIIKNEELRSLNLSRNSIQDKGIENICRAFIRRGSGWQKATPVVEALKFSFCSFADTGLLSLGALIEQLPKSTEPIEIDVSGNTFSTSSITYLTTAVVNSNIVGKLTISDWGNLQENDGRLLGKMLQHASKLEKLDYSGNGLNEASIEAIWDGLYENYSLKELVLSVPRDIRASLNELGVSFTVVSN